MATKNITKTPTKAFEEARAAILKLESLVRSLSPADLETLEILLDKKAVNLLSRSFKEAREGKLLSIGSILK